jgi:hypothetical protein
MIHNAVRPPRASTASTTSPARDGGERFSARLLAGCMPGPQDQRLSAPRRGCTPRCSSETVGSDTRTRTTVPVEAPKTRAPRRTIFQRTRTQVDLRLAGNPLLPGRRGDRRAAPRFEEATIRYRGAQRPSTRPPDVTARASLGPIAPTSPAGGIGWPHSLQYSSSPRFSCPAELTAIPHAPGSRPSRL